MPLAARRRLVPLLALATAALAAACSESSLGPGPLDATYVLRTVDGQPVPARAVTTPVSHWDYVADTIRLRRDGMAAYRTVIRSGTPDAPGAAQVQASEYEREYRHAGTRIVIGRFTPCPPNALCAANDTGRVTRDRLVLAYESVTQNPTRVYERIEQPHP